MLLAYLTDAQDHSSERSSISNSSRITSSDIYNQILHPRPQMPESYGTFTLRLKHGLGNTARTMNNLKYFYEPFLYIRVPNSLKQRFQ
jgi:hypothetical protein